LDRLQSYFGNSAAALLTLCLCVLRRAGSPAADPLHAFLFAAPTGAAVTRRESVERFTVFRRALGLEAG
jgi:hypothetical protein